MPSNMNSFLQSYLRSFLGHRYAQCNFPGMVVGISYKGRKILSESYGFADKQKRIKMRTNHLFRIASHSKTFTATAIMKLAEERRLSISDKLLKHIPELSRVRGFSTITIKDLLTHSAGVIRDGTDCDYWQLKFGFLKDRDIQKLVQKTGLIISPRSELKYSNIGYALLGKIIERCTNQSYDAAIEELIIQPLKLNSTSTEWYPALTSKLAVGYTRIDPETKKRSPFRHISTEAMAAATGFCSTAEDLLTFFNTLCSNSNQIISNRSKKMMQRSLCSVPLSEPKAAYGLGLLTEKIGARRVFGHSGGFPGFRTLSLFDPKDELIVVVLMNCIDGPIYDVVRGLFKTIDFFLTCGRTNRSKLSFYGRFSGVFSELDLVVQGDRAYAGSPDLWNPFINCDVLRRKAYTKFVIEKCNGFGNRGETFNVVSSTKIRVGGISMNRIG